jgi:VanZ family protein
MRYAPPLLWMAVITGLSTDAFSADNTGGYVLPLLHWLLPGLPSADLDVLHTAIRKAAHVCEYGVLSLLWIRAVRLPGSAWSVHQGLMALSLSVVCAALDEFHQAFVPSREARVLDVGWDTLGAVIALAMYAAVWRTRNRGPS